jgi:acetylornithine deacetylase
VTDPDMVRRLLGAADSARERVVSLTSELVRIPSDSGDEGEISQYVEGWARDVGLDVDTWIPDLNALREHRAFVPVGYDYGSRHNIVATLRGRGTAPKRSLILWGHVDTVPVDKNTVWAYPPTSGLVVDGRIYGRGATDMKAGCAVAMVAIETIIALGVSLEGDLSVHLIIDEEAGGNGTLSAVLRGHYRAGAACIMLEPTGSRVVRISGRGAQYFRIRVPGQEGATEYHRDLVSALDPAITLYQATKGYARVREAQAHHPLYDLAIEDPRARSKVPLAICRFQAGAWPSTVPGEAVLEGTIECLPGEDIHDVVADFERFLREVAADDWWLRDHPFRFETFGLWFESAALDVDDPFVQSMVRCGADAFGISPCIGPGGGSDLRLPVLYADCPTILWGPGGSVPHSVDEWADVDDIVAMLKAIMLAAADWCGPVAS